MLMIDCLPITLSAKTEVRINVSDNDLLWTFMST
jgi:hypothetical protein